MTTGEARSASARALARSSCATTWPARPPARGGGAGGGEARARNLVADALQRVAASHASETTVSLVELPSDDMKGRIIGREGRNIRALEHLTGVDFIIDDTPQAVVLSSFDGIRREIAKLTLVKLIEDGRIHPARIEEMYYQSKAEIDDHIRQVGEQAVFEANCGQLHEELVKILGRLHYRTSYGQNVLKHTLEVVHLAGIMASELQASVKTAKRAALLHDLGKALTHEIEGSHASISAQYARRYGETQAVVHAIEAHHYEVQPQTVEAVLVIAADAISGAPRRAWRQPRELHQAARGARGDRGPEEGRRAGVCAAGRTRDPRDRQAGRGRRRLGGPPVAGDRPGDRGRPRVPRPGEGDGDPRVPRDRVREVARTPPPRAARASAHIPTLGGESGLHPPPNGDRSRGPRTLRAGFVPISPAAEARRCRLLQFETVGESAAPAYHCGP